MGKCAWNSSCYGRFKNHTKWHTQIFSQPVPHVPNKKLKFHCNIQINHSKLFLIVHISGWSWLIFHKINNYKHTIQSEDLLVTEVNIKVLDPWDLLHCHLGPMTLTKVIISKVKVMSQLENCVFSPNWRVLLMFEFDIDLWPYTFLWNLSDAIILTEIWNNKKCLDHYLRNFITYWPILFLPIVKGITLFIVSENSKQFKRPMGSFAMTKRTNVLDKGHTINGQDVLDLIL